MSQATHNGLAEGSTPSSLTNPIDQPDEKTALTVEMLESLGGDPEVKAAVWIPERTHGVPSKRDGNTVDIEVGAIACSQWVNGNDYGEPRWNRLKDTEKEEYRLQAKSCAEAWHLKWK